MSVLDVAPRGPYGNCLRECCEREFGALVPLPTGYSVWWHAEHEHYQAHGPAEWESVITVNPYHARRWCFDHAGPPSCEQYGCAHGYHAVQCPVRSASTEESDDGE